MMSEKIEIHPKDPQPRLVLRVAEAILNDKIIAYPTDSGYALGCRLENKEGVERIRKIRALDKYHNFTLFCADLSELSLYAQVDNSAFRLLKAYTPGPYTFILNASKQVPRRLLQPSRKTIGIRIPDHRFCQMLLRELKEPLMSVSLLIPPADDAEEPITIDDLYAVIEYKVDFFIDVGNCIMQPTSVVDLTTGIPKIIRIGQGDVSKM